MLDCRKNWFVVLLLLGAGCRSSPAVSDKGQAPAGSGTSEAPPPPAVPEEQRRAALNPGDAKAYSGPVGTVAGTVRVSGPTAPELPEVLAKIPAGKCDDGRAFYGKLFREGPGRELGDVLVAVTGYQGFIPPKDEPKVVTAKGCAFESRTLAMVFGQELLVRNRGPEPFIPLLENSGQLAVMVAMPGGDPVRLFPSKVGQYRLSDQSHPFATADVFVLKYPTFAVTGVDGRFAISGIPVGEVIVSAHLPATKQTATQRVVIESGKVVTLDLTLPFAPAAAPAQGTGPAGAAGAAAPAP